MEPNLVQTPFFLAREFLLKTNPLRSARHRNMTLHSYFRCKSLHWLLQSSIYLLKFQFFYHHQYWSVANTLAVSFLILVARFYIDSFFSKHKALIHPKKSYFSKRSKSSSCASYTQQSVVADVGHLAIVFSS